VLSNEHELSVKSLYEAWPAAFSFNIAEPMFIRDLFHLDLAVEGLTVPKVLASALKTLGASGNTVLSPIVSAIHAAFPDEGLP
jgi:hypothetical protein